MALEKYNSTCELNQKIIICKDKGNSQKYIAENIDKSKVYKYQIDGYVITEGKKCDFLVWNEDKKNIYLIELKGTDLEHAIDQIISTENVLRESFFSSIDGCQFYYRVVLNRVPTHALHSNKIKKLMKNKMHSLQYKTKEFREKI